MDQAVPTEEGIMSAAKEQAIRERALEQGRAEGYLRGEALAGDIVDRLDDHRAWLTAHMAQEPTERGLHIAVAATQRVLDGILGQVEGTRTEMGAAPTTEASTGQQSDDVEQVLMPSGVKLNLMDVPRALPPGDYSAVVSGLTVVDSHMPGQTTYVLNAVFRAGDKNKEGE